MGELEIPIGSFHRSISGKDGSVVINHAIRDEQFEPSIEFNPISIEYRSDLQTSKTIESIIWLWKDRKIHRIKDSIFSESCLNRSNF